MPAGELAAFDLLEGIDDRHRWERIEHILAVGFSTLATLWAKDPVNPSAFVPPARIKVVQKKEAKNNIAAQKILLRQVVALHNGRN